MYDIVGEVPAQRVGRHVRLALGEGRERRTMARQKIAAREGYTPKRV